MRFYFVSFQASIYDATGTMTTSLGSRVVHREKPISSPDDIAEVENEIRSMYMDTLKSLFNTKAMIITILNWRSMEDAE
jgi:hypothetical protein